MPLFFTRKRRLYAALALGLIVAVLAQQYHLFARTWFALRSWHYSEQWREESLWLDDYQVAIEGREIDGISELSALTYDPDRGSLFSVTNDPAQLVELSLTGELKRVVALKGFGDPEAIEYVAPNTYVIADEREQRLVKVLLDDNAEVLDAADFKQLSLSLGGKSNKGFEGLAYDSAQQRLLVAKERNPVQIYEVRGFVNSDPQRPLALSVHTDAKRDARLFVRDLSSLDFDQASGHLLVLSDESRLLLELNAKGKPISSLALRAGSHGLRRSVPQAEGVATDMQGNVYLISEPNLFYLFRPAR